MTDGVSLADIAAVTDNKDGMFGGAGGGVIRYPNATTYTAGMSPCWSNSCCNNGVNI